MHHIRRSILLPFVIVKCVKVHKTYCGSKGFQRFIHNPSREVYTELKTNSSSVIHEQNRGYTRRHSHTRRRRWGKSGCMADKSD